MVITPKLLSSGPYLTAANVFLGMILMVVLNCLLTGIKSRDKNYLHLALFFAGTLINAVSNLYTRFFIPTIEPYIGSWISLFAFTLFAYNYLNIKTAGTIRLGRNILATACIFFVILSIIHNIINKNQNNLTILIMDISAALIILALLISLIVLRIRGNKNAGTLIIFESLMIVGAVSAMGIFKDAVAGTGIPEQLLQGNFMFLTGMTFNGLLFSFILGTEMTELRINHALAEREKKELQQLDQAKNDFMMNISHELRTPVTVISGIIRQLRSGRWGNSIKAADSQFEMIERNNLRLTKQINGLLELSQLEQHRFELKPGLTDLNQKLSLFASEFHSAAEQKHISLRVTCAEPIKLYADPHLLDTAVLNLLNNAIKFTQPGGIVELAAERKHNHVIIKVSDNGPGISEEQHEKIFQRFQQVEQSGASSWRGAGIGLSLVKGIMQLHSGKVKLNSRPGEGSEFSLIFPQNAQAKKTFSSTGIDPIVSAYKADLVSSLAENITEIKDSDTADGRKENILIVEDNKDLLFYLETELKKSFNTAIASNGKAALELLKSFKPSLIISDVMMPEMDGKQLFLKLRSTPEYAGIPFLFLTARNSLDEKIEALNDGAVDYINKPFSIEELNAKANGIISSVNSHDESYQKSLKKSVIDFIDNFDKSEKEPVNNDFDSLCLLKQLTAREKEIAALLRRGMSDKEIASKLKLSVKTISNYNTSVFRKLEVSGRAELIALNR